MTDKLSNQTTQQTNQPFNQRTDMRGHRQVSLPIVWRVYKFTFVNLLLLGDLVGQLVLGLLLPLLLHPLHHNNNNVETVNHSKKARTHVRVNVCTCFPSSSTPLSVLLSLHFLALWIPPPPPPPLPPPLPTPSAPTLSYSCLALSSNSFFLLVSSTALTSSSFSLCK